MALPQRRTYGRGLGLWEPFTDLEQTVRRMNDLVEQVFPNLPTINALDDAFTPLADLEETDDAYVLEAELPGVKKQDITVEALGRRITITGERKEKERTGVLRQRTRTVGRFFLEVQVPGEVDPDRIEATLEDGVLTVRIPKAESDRAQTRKIEIR